jgi:hypothetical protein
MNIESVIGSSKFQEANGVTLLTLEKQFKPETFMILDCKMPHLLLWVWTWKIRWDECRINLTSL